MKICFLCNEYPPARHGGIGVFTQLMARSLASAGHEVRVLGTTPSPVPRPPSPEEDCGVRVWRITEPARWLGWLAARWRLARTVSRWAHRGEIDLLEAPDYEGWVAGWPAMPVPLVIRMHGSLGYFAAETGTRGAGPIFWVERAAFERADALCSVSRYAAERTRTLFRLGADVAVLHNPVELPERPPVWPRPGHDVVFSGTLTAKKGIHVLIRAWPLVLKENSAATLHVFGKDGRTPYGGSMREALVRQLGAAAASVRFYGHVSRETLFGALETARAAVFPSLAEAFALAPLEALAHGCATICSRRGSGPEMISDGRDGLLVDPADPGEIARAIGRLLAAPALAARLGEAGWNRVRREFSCDVLRRKNEEYYAGCLERFQLR